MTKHFNVDDPESVCVCPSQPISQILITHGTVAASDMRMHHVLIILIVTTEIRNVQLFLNCSSSSHQVYGEGSPTKRLYIANSVQWPCSSPKVTTASQSQTWQKMYLYYNSKSRTVFKLWPSNLAWWWIYAWHVWPSTLMQGQNGSSKAKTISV